ncbi:MAG TPA: multicopper oxidase domain-containing protein [Candidatus Angelobacter sp.]
MSRFSRNFVRLLTGAAILLISPLSMLASGPTPVAPVSNPCSRPTPGSTVHQPPALFSSNGVLNVQFSYQASTDAAGRQTFCFMTPSGLENPTLHVNPGDTLNITVTNNTPFNPVGDTTEVFGSQFSPTCGDTVFEQQAPSQNSGGFNMSGGSMNIHYHGTNTSPLCHGDNVVKTLVNPGHTFSYNLQFPTNEPPGLYWYHPHVHGLAEAAVQGGAAGALVVDGINNVQPAVASLRHRILVIRDQPIKQPGISESPANTDTPFGIPQADLSVNFVSINTTVNTNNNPPTVSYTPAVIHMMSGEQQFWRVCNCTSDAPLDLAVQFDGVNQTIQLAGIDAVPVNSQDGTQPGHLIPVTHYRIPPAGRVEFLVNAPSSTVKKAQLVAQLINSGPLGDDLPTRPLLSISVVGDSDNDEPLPDDRVPAFNYLNTNQQRFTGIMNVTPSVTRTVFFEEFEDGSLFFINASGCVTSTGAQCAIQPYAIDTPFDSNNPPAIVTTQGSVEKWLVQNHARENHELHQHQIHFKVLSQDNFEVNGSPQAPGINGQFLDMVEVPFCGGDPSPTTPAPPACLTANGGGPPLPYPQVTALMDFRGPDIGAFVFHCHILGHEDRGMMAIEQVNSH